MLIVFQFEIENMYLLSVLTPANIHQWTLKENRQLNKYKCTRCTYLFYQYSTVLQRKLVYMIFIVVCLVGLIE